MKSETQYRCWAEIDLRALSQNVKLIRQNLPPETLYFSVVKANAYGFGVLPLLPTLRKAGTAAFAVATVTEGAEIRTVDPETPILLLSAPTPEEREAVFQYNLTPLLSSESEISHFQQLAQKLNRTLPVHLLFDTGMGRLGTWFSNPESAFNSIAKAPNLLLRGICSHFASADSDPDFTQLQRNRLLQIIHKQYPDGLPPNLLLHIDNSAGLPSFNKSSGFNAVRVGLLQYGADPGHPSGTHPFPINPVLSLHARATLIKELPKGATVSYSRTHTLSRNSRIAIVSAGYADGISRACGNRGSALIRGQRCPILGVVTMDNFMIDVTDVPEAETGDIVTIIGRQDKEEITINTFSEISGLIPWQAFCAIGNRVKRIYKNS